LPACLFCRVQAWRRHPVTRLSWASWRKCRVSMPVNRAHWSARDLREDARRLARVSPPAVDHTDNAVLNPLWLCVEGTLLTLRATRCRETVRRPCRTSAAENDRPRRISRSACNPRIRPLHCGNDAAHAPAQLHLEINFLGFKQSIEGRQDVGLIKPVPRPQYPLEFYRDGVRDE